MNSINQRMCISQCLEKHPILQEKLKNKMCYIAVLQYFCEKYNARDTFSFAMLDLYKEVFLEKKIVNYKYNPQEIRSAMRCASGIKLKGFRLFTYRFTLIVDCLFLCSFRNEEKGKEILTELKSLFNSMYHKKMDSLFATLYHQSPLRKGIGLVEYLISCWTQNDTYIEAPAKCILITANMSAGKSTLINALVGKTVSQTKNDACTAKLHYIQSKAFEDFFDYEYDHSLCLNADRSMLMEDNQDNTSEVIVVGTYFRLIGKYKEKICFIDTPGVNSSLDYAHRNITEKAVSHGDYDKLIYVINGENIGTDDDRRYLGYIAEVAKSKKVIFVLNKLDRFKQSEDDITESIKKIRAEVERIGFVDAVICPISAYAGLLGKKKIWGESLTEDETDELDVLRRKFKKAEYDLSKYYLPASQKYGQSIVDNEKDAMRKKYLSLLNGAGILAMENLLFE